jgi:hypothetical protein
MSLRYYRGTIQGIQSLVLADERTDLHGIIQDYEHDHGHVISLTDKIKWQQARKILDNIINANVCRTDIADDIYMFGMRALDLKSMRPKIAMAEICQRQYGAPKGLPTIFDLRNN